ncbi:CDP-diacylglycerol--glycerol-3-phosphate 3-phosphatidyltransferase [Hyphomicrobium sp. CS1BSMeth3]|uniref:CDP-diacylglycerol--glycerol-3-phosphate 3-phosphatidyltransferase n=1 Tax=Hyphomicrobium sp. CS1BSMeth3 TaxID=1892844 RepID=UPI00093079CF|nr:CDP-diacylglycerol--glycerol-3-phosphate 3-phosphatidyltransferase [Hyphomicrobium sp. CS1BSMeth3]MBN9267233.1 CDP-diacylglycerol--glycerol-3-phosphate 3-phosphatidyltransferase [Hyphomicrobium sp.]
MERTATRPTTLTTLPNVLTYGRIVAVPLMAACFLLLEGDNAHWAALSIFTLACLTDWLDGYLARILAQQSTLGRMLDPIADKLLVGTALLLLVNDGTIDYITIWAAIIILCREILVSGLREYLAELNVKVHVTRLAKWKTTVQMLALGVLLAGPAGEKLISGVTLTGTMLLWAAALLTLWTGYDYLKAAVRHAIDN